MRGIKKVEETHHTPHHGEKHSSKGFPKILSLVLVIVIVCMIANYMLFRVALLQHEYSKVGGKQNYDILSSLQMQQIDSVLQYYKSNPETLTNQLTNNEATVATNSQLDGVSLGSMQEEYAKLGDENADIILVEYSDLECPYCKQQNEANAYEGLSQKYPGKISYMFKHFPLSSHPGSQKKHEALECVRKLVGDNAYFEMKDTIFGENSYQAAINSEAVEAIAVGLGANQSEFSTCVDSGEFTKKIQDSISEGKNYFGVNATPSTILINKKTGEFKMFSGVQQESSLESTIKDLLGE